MKVIMSDIITVWPDREFRLLQPGGRGAELGPRPRCRADSRQPETIAALLICCSPSRARWYCRSAAPPSAFSGRFNGKGAGMSADNSKLLPECLIPLQQHLIFRLARGERRQQNGMYTGNG